MKKDVPSLIQLAGGEIVGKIRLQKEVYLLDQIGLRSGFSFEYHHYGPYSEELAEQVEDDVIFGRLNANSGRRVSDGVPYVIYRASKAGDGDRVDQHLPLDQIKSALFEMQRCSATVLELAATIHWLAYVEARRDWKEELVRRKGAKTQDGRDKQALELLKNLELSPVA
ncbi:hypothetical protein [Bradyrhizobium sp. CCBAU 45389]|uniref:hypothetical protein n=1 Tax=Bradyrhizobium sp. CCBAU 45389 TaxID=858429 RepID=UPI002305DDD2|nr:hypothetical protein [Bradyrhizobium sp. CCBAU 45389]MDA9398401.1 hypothetical protein [Bradyrhizobium sp. CCBAU 45389]